MPSCDLTCTQFVPPLIVAVRQESCPEVEVANRYTSFLRQMGEGGPSCLHASNSPPTFSISAMEFSGSSAPARRYMRASLYLSTSDPRSRYRLPAMFSIETTGGWADSNSRRVKVLLRPGCAPRLNGTT